MKPANLKNEINGDQVLIVENKLVGILIERVCVFEAGVEGVRGEDQKISFLVVARAAALRRAERRPAALGRTATNSALAVILHFGFVNLYLNLHAQRPL